MSIIKKAQELQDRIENRTKRAKKQYYNASSEEKTKWQWRDYDPTLFLFITIVCFAAHHFMLFSKIYYKLDYIHRDFWLVPIGVGMMALFLFFISSGALKDEN